MADLHGALYEIAERCQPATVRQVFYQATIAGIVEKTEAAYGAVQRALADMRRSGRLPYGWIADGTRWQRRPVAWDSIEDALAETARLYRRRLWTDADIYLEVWLEKDALAGVVFPVTSKWDVPLMVARGYASLSFLHSSAEAITAAARPAVILHLGDFDPSGQDAARSIETSLREMAPGSDIIFRRLAVTPEQIHEWRLPGRPTKSTDTRARTWTGGDSVELDAIPPATLRHLVDDEIVRYVDHRQLQVLLEAEESEREGLLQLAEAVRGDGSEAGR